jgi:hypothetical protein
MRVFPSLSLLVYNIFLPLFLLSWICANRIATSRSTLEEWAVTAASTDDVLNEPGLRFGRICVCGRMSIILQSIYMFFAKEASFFMVLFFRKNVPKYRISTSPTKKKIPLQIGLSPSRNKDCSNSFEHTNIMGV